MDVGLMCPRPAPLLVTGMPRSGTTWLARLLSCAAGTALAGREPMNPRGSQYALGGTLDGWTRLREPSRQQRRRLHTAYRGLNPLVYSRYGNRQWAAPLPSTRMIVKDPFALLSLPMLTSVTGALPVIVYRHPGAMLASFRRVGWAANPVELQQLERIPSTHGGGATRWPADEVGNLGATWAALYRMALEDLSSLPAAMVVSHEELATGGESAAKALFAAVSLTWSDSAARFFGGGAASAENSSALHNLDRSPAVVANAWRAKVDAGDVAVLEAGAGDVLEELNRRRFRLLT
jgi:hypothetical protein